MTERPEADLAAATLTWSEQWFDPQVALLWNPEGSFDELAPARTLHLVPQSAWFALGLLARDQPGDRSTATAIFERLVDDQYDRAGTVWHGTFRRFHEAPEPGPDAVEWVDYDPNWRQFIGTTFALALRRCGDRIDAAARRRMEGAIRLAVVGEPPERVGPSYSNIALMRAWLEVEAGGRFGEPAWVERGEALGRAVAERFDRFGAFDEHNSPTYYGIDLYALGLWVREPVSAELHELGHRVEALLWSDAALHYHAGLRNQCGPFSRAYGTDMRRYAALLGLCVWDAVGADRAPFPALDEPFEHSHDTTMGPVLALLGTAVPRDAQARLTSFEGERQIERTIGDDPRREITAWLGEQLMIGAEDGELDVQARGQFMPATAHWAQGTLRVEHHGPTRARAEPHVLRVWTRPHPRHGPQPIRIALDVPSSDLAPMGDARWAAPGMTLSIGGAEIVAATGHGTDAAALVVETDGRAELTIELDPS